jgi:hypothetical protein
MYVTLHIGRIHGRDNSGYLGSGDPDIAGSEGGPDNP